VDARVRELEGRSSADQAAQEGATDRLDAEAGRRAAAMAAHSIGNHEQPLSGRGRELAEGVLVLASGAPDIALGGGEDPSHERL
jgi:hypothetical protein